MLKKNPIQIVAYVLCIPFASTVSLSEFSVEMKASVHLEKLCACFFLPLIHSYQNWTTD